MRNPAIVVAFRWIGLSGQAGTGVRAIFRGWQRLGYVPPLINNDKARKTFELLLLREQLFSEEQQLLQAQLGVKLSETEARLFAFACRQGGASLTDAKAVTGQPGPEARKVLNTLVVQRLLEPMGESDRYGLAEHLKDHFGAAQLGQSTSDQAREGPSARSVTNPAGRGVGHRLVTEQADGSTAAWSLRVPGLVTAQALAGGGLQVWLRPEGGGQRFALVGVDQFAQAEFPRRVQTVADIGLTGLTVALHHSQPCMTMSFSQLERENLPWLQINSSRPASTAP